VIVSKRRWTIDVALIIIVVALGVLVYLRLERLFKSWRDNDGTPASVETTDIEGDFSPTLQARVDIAKQEEVPALDFTLQNLEGKIVALSDHEGTAVLVNFWATWCPPCRAEMPLIQAFADRHEDDLVVLAVNVG
jgi:cytochrome oxidase Cu insertion factor (SCO1/SenC/PrrC family)